MTPLTPTLRATALTLCPLDGAVTHTPHAATPEASLVPHASPALAAHYVASHPGSRILCVGSSYNGGAGLSCADEARLMAEARASLGGAPQ